MKMGGVERAAPLEVRASGRTLVGEAIRYGEQATDRAERFEPGAFQPIGPVVLNLQHDPQIVIASTGDRLTLTDTPRVLRVRAELRDGAALSLLRRGRLSGLSVEFRSIEEHTEKGVRVIDKATLEGVGLVDVGSYAGDVELRRRGGTTWFGTTYRSTIPARAKLRCECGGDALCKWATFIPEAVEEMLDAAFEGAAQQIVAEIESGLRPTPAGVLEEGRAAREVIACWNNYSSPLASVSRGTLRRSGRYGVEIDLPDDDNGRAVLAAQESTGVIIRPHLDMSESEYDQDGDVLVYSKARVRAFIVSATDAREGWPSPELVTADGEQVGNRGSTERAALAMPRRRLWL